MTSAELFAFVKEGGAYCAPLLLLALWAVERERRRQIAVNEADQKRFLDSLSKKDALIAAKDSKIESLAERITTVASAINTYLFSKGVSPL